MDKRIPSLDGLRALSISLVIASHLTLEHPLPILWRVQYGKLGVRVFFVISGFLITSLLLKELQRTGRISLAGFYVRRLFRIAPAYYLFLAAMVLLIPTGYVMATYQNALYSAFYLNDYTFSGGTLGHTWSLAVEEQFYLLWPVALVLLGLKRAPYACALMLLTAPAFRLLSSYGLWPTDPQLAFESVCDALATGCLLAMLREQLWSVDIYRSAVSSRWVLMIPIGALLAMAVAPSSMLLWTMGLSVLNLGIAMALDRYMRFPQSIFGQMLNWRPIAWIGTISYSLYLWQQPFLTGSLGWPWYIKVACALACATASFYAIERPFLKLRKRVDKKPTSSREFSESAKQSTLG